MKKGGATGAALDVCGVRGDFSLAALASPRTIALMILAMVGIGWVAAPTGLFTVDEYFYTRAADAMASERALDFQQFDVASAPALDMNFASPSAEAARLAPQYPSGYALIAAPFFAAFGVKGLMLLNAIAGLLCLALTSRLAKKLGADETGATLAISILALATYWTSYLFAVWPHMLALAIILLVIERLLLAGEGNWRAAAAAGLLAGVGQNVRIDMIALAPAAIVWLRLFCVGDTRRLCAIFLAAVAPGILAAAAVNEAKFGAFNPFTYENEVASNVPADFGIVAIAVAVLLVAILTFDLKKWMALLASPRGLTATAAVVALAILASAPARSLIAGFYYSLVDAQAFQHSGRQPGIARDEWGWLVFYGFSKKALAQSLPFISLLILPAVRFFKGAMTPGEALLSLVAGGYVTLYSVNQTDSGLGLNARFLFPLLPVLAILAAAEIRKLAAAGEVGANAFVRAALLSASAFLAMRLWNMARGEFSVPLDLYPQLALTAVLAAVAFHVSFQESRRNARRAAYCAALSIGAASAISLTDFAHERAYRAHIAAQSRLYAAAIPADGLVFTTRPILFARGAAKGLGVAYPGIASPEEELAAVRAYQDAGRCAYAQGAGALEWLDLHSILSGMPRRLGPTFAQGGLAGIDGNPARCP